MAWDFTEELKRYGPSSGDSAMSSDGARAYCASVTRRHYENFTVASWLLPRKLVPHFEAVYAYCRWADDLADETGGGENALGLLDWWRSGLMGCYDGNSTHPVFIALRETIRTFSIPSKPFLDLLIAFEQDQRIPKYDTFDQLLGYCRNSANPVGHLVLYLFETFDVTKAALSDEICTGLQQANFWQDVARDFEKGRIYLPREDRERFGVSDDQLRAWVEPASRRFDNRKTGGTPVPPLPIPPAFRELLKFEVDRTRGFFERGLQLLPRLPRKARVDVELFALGGEAVLRAIEKQNYDVLTSRPRIGKLTKAKLLGRALLGQLRG